MPIPRDTRQVLHAALCDRIRPSAAEVRRQNATLDDVCTVLRENLHHRVAEVRRGGSTAKGTAIRGSDVDIVVQLVEPLAADIASWMPVVLMEIRDIVRNFVRGTTFGETRYYVDPVRRTTPYAVQCNIPSAGGEVIAMDILPTCKEGMMNPILLPNAYVRLCRQTLPSSCSTLFYMCINISLSLSPSF